MNIKSAQSISVSHDTNIPYVEYQNSPVVTFSMVDKVHCRADGNARKRFNENRRHFVEGEDFYRVDSSQMSVFRTFGITIPPRGIIVLTESGYLLLVKSFTDDLAWQVQKQLIKVYFRAKAGDAGQPEPPKPASEPLSASDRYNLSRLVRCITEGQRYSQAWNFSIWKALRRVTRTASPAPFEVDHLPVLAAELERIYTAVARWEDIKREFEIVLLRRVFRNGEAADAVIDQVKADLAAKDAQSASEMGAVLAPWRRHDVQALRQRQDNALPRMGCPEEAEEPTDK